jgi:hypothetical protein
VLVVKRIPFSLVELAVERSFLLEAPQRCRENFVLAFYAAIRFAQSRFVGSYQSLSATSFTAKASGEGVELANKAA